MAEVELYGHIPVTVVVDTVRREVVKVLIDVGEMERADLAGASTLDLDVLDEAFEIAALETIWPVWEIGSR